MTMRIALLRTALAGALTILPAATITAQPRTAPARPEDPARSLVPDERKIGLSIRALKDAEYRADWEAYTESTGRPEVTLGDHFKNLK